MTVEADPPLPAEVDAAPPDEDDEPSAIAVAAPDGASTNPGARAVRHDLRGVGRRRRALGAAAATLLVVAAATGWWSARATLADTRNRLATTRADLAARQEELTNAEREEALVEATTEQVRSDIDEAVDGRTWIEAATADTMAEMGAVEADRSDVATAIDLVTAHSADTMACIGGVSSAVDASARGDDGTSADSLRSAADACARTLAYAAGTPFPYDFADPYVLAAEGAYYGYSTNSGAGDIQVIRSTDMATWELVGNALPRLPGWAKPGATWAPSVLARPGGYVAYYTTRARASRLQCVSRAVAASPTGPFVDDSDGPLVCQGEHGGSIDPSPFVDADGRAWLLWKSEGRDDAPQIIWSQELTADGLALTGPAHPLISADRWFERGVVEAPSLVRADGAYHLVYAAADWNSRSYAVAVATCAGPAGPCTKPGDGRVLTSGPRLAGPGGAEVFRDHDGRLWAAFHAFAEPRVGYPASRYLHLAPVAVSGGRLTIDAAT